MHEREGYQRICSDTKPITIENYRSRSLRPVLKGAYLLIGLFLTGNKFHWLKMGVAYNQLSFFCRFSSIALRNCSVVK